MGTLHKNHCILYYIILYYLAEFFLEWGMFQAKFVEKIKTRVMFNRFFPKILPFVI